jgi:hypothetical protein
MDHVIGRTNRKGKPFADVQKGKLAEGRVLGLGGEAGRGR